MQNVSDFSLFLWFIGFAFYDWGYVTMSLNHYNGIDIQFRNGKGDGAILHGIPR